MSYRETLATGTGSARIRIDEMKSLSIQSIGEFKHRIEKIEYAFHIGHQLHALVVEDLVRWLLFVIETHFVTQT
jgi:hypothetical protein